MTERLYYRDSHLTEFTSRVISVGETDAHRFAVTLDRTAFYPTGGGQPFDTGTIGRARVVDCVSDDTHDEVRHIIEGEQPRPDADVGCRVDWPRRVRALEEIAARVEAEEMLAETASNDKGVRVITRTFERRDAEPLKRLALAVATHSRAIALLGTINGEAVRLAFARADDLDIDMNHLMREACTALDGRGGGRADFAQGGGQTRSAQHLAEIIERTRRQIES